LLAANFSSFLILVANRMIFWIADPVSEVAVECKNAKAKLLRRNASMRTRMLIGLHVLYDLLGERVCMSLDQFNYPT